MNFHRSKAVAIGVICMALLLAGGCAHKTSTSGQAIPVSPWEQFNVNFAQLAVINNGLAKGVITLNQTNLLTTAQASPILTYQYQVAQNHAAVENIIQNGTQSAINNQNTAISYLTAIGSQGQALLKDGGLDVKNPNSQKTIGEDLQGIVDLSKTLVTEYQTVVAQLKASK